MTLSLPGLGDGMLASRDGVADVGWRTHNLGALLFAATDRSVQEKLRVMHASGFGAITDAQLALFHHLDRDGAGLTTIAARAGLTKQAMIELVDRAEALGLVERRPDPTDKRAKIVHPTAKGLHLLDALQSSITVAEAHVAAIVGSDFLAEMKQRLGLYSAVGPPVGEAEPQPIGRLLALSARRFAAEALAASRRDRRDDVVEVLLALFRNLDLGGTRLTDIAARARMTKQSMRELVDRAEKLGFVVRHPDPADRRAKIVRFTDAGMTMLADLRTGIEQAEAIFSHAAGTAFTSRLRTRLIDYAAGPARPQAVPATGSTGT